MIVLDHHGSHAYPLIFGLQSSNTHLQLTCFHPYLLTSASQIKFNHEPGNIENQLSASFILIDFLA